MLEQMLHGVHREVWVQNSCLFTRELDGRKIILAIYVDDGLIAADDGRDIEPVMEHLQRRFDIKALDVKTFLGIEIDIRKNGDIHLCQAAYGRKVLAKFKMEECNAVSTPMDTNQAVSKFENSEVNEEYPYREAVGSLMYLCVATRPDIQYAVGVASRYLEKPTDAHVNAVKRILKYIKGTIDYGIVFRSDGIEGLAAYSDADYAGDGETRRSTSGVILMFNGGPVSWESTRQKSVALSTTESEYMAATVAVKELIWLKRLIESLVELKEKPELNMDNQSAIRLVKNPEFHKRTKHIDVRYHFIRERYEEGLFNLSYVRTDEELGDILTKALNKDRFEALRKMIAIEKRK